jgi:hypothetical protein
VLIHLARGHRELAMVDRTEAADVTVDWHIVGWIDKDSCGALLAHEHLVGTLLGRAGTKDAMPP